MITKGARLVQHVPIEPHWPRYGFRPDGTQIDLRFVEPDLQPDARGAVYYVDAKGNYVFPWKESGYYVDANGEVLTGATGDYVKPMARAELESLGMTDESLSAALGLAPWESLDSGAEDTLAAREQRRLAFDKWTQSMGVGI